MASGGDSVVARLDRAYGARLDGLERRLNGFASARAWRTVSATLAAALTAACFSAGLAAYAVPAQIGLVAGLVAALIAPGIAEAAGAGAVGAALAWLLAPANAWASDPAAGRAVGVLVSVVVAAVLAAGGRYAIGRRWIRPAPIAWACVALIVANLWVTALSANSAPTFDPTTGAQSPSFNEQLAAGEFEAMDSSDDAWFYRVYASVRDGAAYYPTFAKALRDNPNWSPTTPMAFRVPVFFWMLSAVKNPLWVPRAFLVLATVATAAVVFANRQSVKMPFALPAAAALAAYAAYFPVQLPVFSQEAWAAMLGVIAIAAFSIGRVASRWRAWVVTAVVLAVFGTLVRETLVLLPIAGLLAAMLEPEERRRFSLLAWGTGVVVIAAAYVAHVAALRPYLVAGPSTFGSGSVRFAAAAFTYATDLLGYPGALPVVLGVLGVGGALLVPDLTLRVLVSGAVLLPLAIFLVVGNRAWYETTGEVINYWGATVVPLSYAAIPTAFVPLPGTRLSRPGVAPSGAKPVDRSHAGRSRKGR